MGTLRITEIFLSLQGEANTVGLPTVFVRLTGCPLRCQYCDTEYAFTGGDVRAVEGIVAEVVAHDVSHVTVTGGEPLAQPNVHSLLTQLCELGKQVSLETSGAMDISDVDGRVSRVLDLKTPGSLECNRNLMGNLDLLTPHDQVKFVICDVHDYNWASAQINRPQLQQFGGEILFSPVWNSLPAAQLADWIVRDRLPVRFQVQLHKILWGDVAGR